MEITQHGRVLFTVSTGSSTISRCVIAPGGALTLLGSTPVGVTGGRDPLVLISRLSGDQTRAIRDVADIAYSTAEGTQAARSGSGASPAA